MFSTRLHWSSPANALSRLLILKRRGGRSLLDLTESNPTRAGIDYPADDIRAALAGPGIAAYDPSPRGLPSAREAVASAWSKEGRPVGADRIVLTAGTSEAYGLLFKLLADPGETVLVPRPSYPLFADLASLEAVRPLAYPIVYDGRWRIDLEALGRLLEEEAAGVRALIVVNPNNPTGQALTRDERAALETLCAPRGIAIISDEVFFDYLDYPDGLHEARPGSSPISMVGSPDVAGRERALSFTLGGLSKSCGLPQMKLGWIAVDGPDDLVRGALERLDWIADTYLTVSTPVQLAAARLLAIGGAIRESVRRRVIENRASLVAAVGPRSPCEVLAADGGWYAVLRLPAIVPEEEFILRLLDEADVVVHPGYFFDFDSEAYLVLSLLPEPSIFREGVERILARAVG